MRYHLALLSVLFLSACAACGPSTREDCETPDCAAGVRAAPLPCGDYSGCDEEPPGGDDSGGWTCRAPLECPGFCAYVSNGPCLTERFTGYTVQSYREAPDGSGCTAVRQYYVWDDGTCFGMDRVVGESITSCGG